LGLLTSASRDTSIQLETFISQSPTPMAALLGRESNGAMDRVGSLDHGTLIHPKHIAHSCQWILYLF